MSNVDWKAYQPDYDEELVLLAKLNRLKEHAKEDIHTISTADIASKDKTKISYLVQKLSSYVLTLETNITLCETRISGHKEYYKKRNKLNYREDDYLYDQYDDNVRLNTINLNSYSTKCQGEFLKVDLISFNDYKEDYLSTEVSFDPIQTWQDTLKTFEKENIKEFIPFVSEPKFVSRTWEKLHGNKGAINVNVATRPKLIFRYADNNEVIKNRYIIHWLFQKETQDDKDIVSTRKIKSEDKKNAAFMTPVGFGQTGAEEGIFRKAPWVYFVNSGGISTGTPYFSSFLSPDSRKIDRKIEGEEKDKTKRLYLWEASSGSKEGVVSTVTDFDPNTKRAFFLYPMDQGRFKTKDLNILSNPDQGEAPENDPHRSAPSKGVVKKLRLADLNFFPNSYISDHIKNRHEIKLHCTLPEWNYRLKDKLKKLKYLTEAHQLACMPHNRNLNYLAGLGNLIELQFKHSYAFVSDEQIAEREKLKKAVSSLYKGIQVQLESPTKEAEYSVFSGVAECFEDMDKAASELWLLLKSDAFIKEMQRYLDAVKGKTITDKDGVTWYPPGPDMEQEPLWNDIFFTISLCYEELSKCTRVANLVWEDDIMHGLEELAAMPGVGEELDEVKKTLLEEEDENAKSITEKQFKNFDIDTAELEGRLKNPPQGLLATIIRGFDVATEYRNAAKPLLDQVIRTAGMPCLLQVVFGHYDTKITAHILKKKIPTYHLRVFTGYLKQHHFRVKGPNNTLGLKAVYKSFSVSRKRGKVSFPNGKSGKKALKKILDDPFNKDKKSSEDKFYGKFNKPTAVAAKGLYGIFNLVLTVQGLITKAVDKHENHEDYTILEVIKISTTLVGLYVTVGSLHKIVGRLDDFAKGIEKAPPLYWGHLDKVTAILGVVTSVISAYEAFDEYSKGNTEKATVNAAMAFSGFVYTLGYVITEMAKREGSIMATSSIAGPAAPILMGIGTAINVLLLAKDAPAILDSIAALFEYNHAKTSQGIWAAIQQPLDASGQLEARELHKTIKKMTEEYPDIWGDDDAIKGKLKRLELAATRKDTIISAYDKLREKVKKEDISDYEVLVRPELLLIDDPFKGYLAEDAPEKFKELTGNAVNDISNAITDESLWGKRAAGQGSIWVRDYYGVEWEQLSWRAVVPLFEDNYTPHEIEGMVNLSNIKSAYHFTDNGSLEGMPELRRQEGYKDSIKSVKDIIDFYKMAADSELTYKNGRIVADELREGVFVPDEELSKLWMHPEFKLLANTKGQGLLPKVSILDQPIDHQD